MVFQPKKNRRADICLNSTQLETLLTFKYQQQHPKTWGKTKTSSKPNKKGGEKPGRSRRLGPRRASRSSHAPPWVRPPIPINPCGVTAIATSLEPSYETAKVGILDNFGFKTDKNHRVFVVQVQFNSSLVKTKEIDEPQDIH